MASFFHELNLCAPSIFPVGLLYILIVVKQSKKSILKTVGDIKTPFSTLFFKFFLPKSKEFEDLGLNLDTSVHKPPLMISYETLHEDFGYQQSLTLQLSKIWGHFKPNDFMGCPYWLFCCFHQFLLLMKTANHPLKKKTIFKMTPDLPYSLW